MVMDRRAKDSLREEFEGKFGKANAAIVAEYRGLSVADLTDLRRELRKSNAEFRVIKNRVAKKALTNAAGFASLSDSLKGPVGIAYLYGDAAAAAKSMVDFEKTKELFKITGGVMESRALTANDVKAIASLPSKEVLLGQLVGLLVAPHRNLLGVLNAVPRNLVQVVNAIKEKKA
jgi:large subunit ribosomal protein L10